MINVNEDEDLEYMSQSGWTRIGILNEIRMRPLETGHGFKVRKAICTKNGLQSLTLSKKSPKSKPQFRYCDRVFVPYKLTGDNYSILNNPLSAECKKIAPFHNAQKIASRIGDGWRLKIDYFGEFLELFEVNCTLNDRSNRQIGEIGYISQKTRNNFFSKYRSSKFNDSDGNIFLSRNYPYTLINTTSLDFLKRENEDIQNIVSIEKFSPNIVIEGNEPYCEDDIVALRIGEDVRFSNLVPCTHRFEECYDDIKSEIEQRKLLNNLKKTRSLQKVHPYLSMSSELPVFGINLQIIQQGEISLNDDVYAKFRDFPIIDVDDREISDTDMEVEEENIL